MGERRAVYPGNTPPPVLSKLPPSQQISAFLLVPPSTPPGLWFFQLSTPLFRHLSLSISVSLARWEMKYSQLPLRSGRAAAGLAEQTEERTCEADGVRLL